MKILGFQSGHDVSYCILENGVPIIHEELERFTREKEPLGDGLDMAFQRIPDGELSEISHICYGNPGGRIGRYQEKCGLEEADKKLKSLDVDYSIIGHHQSHAANAFFSSNFDEALIITIDGSGTDKVDWEDVKSEEGETETFSTAFTFWEGKGTKIKPIKPPQVDVGLSESQPVRVPIFIVLFKFPSPQKRLIRLAAKLIPAAKQPLQ